MNKDKGLIIECIKGIHIIWKYERKSLIVQIIFALFHGISWAMQVVFMQRFFDSTQLLYEGKITVDKSFIALLFMIGSYAFCQVMNGADNCHARILDMAVAKHIKQSIFKKIDKMKSIEFEDKKKLEEINKAIYGGENLVWLSLTLIDIFFFYTTYFLCVSFYLYSLTPIISLSVLAIFIPCLLSDYIQIKAFKKLEDTVAPERRKMEYYEKCIVDVKETRLWGTTKYFGAKFFNSLKKYNALNFKMNVRKNMINLVGDVLTVCGYGVILFLLFRSVLLQKISIGAFAAIITSISRLYSFMSEVISERIGWATENIASLSNYFAFVKFQDENIDRSGENDYFDRIVLKNVNFKYPNAKEYALKNINLEIERGESFAIVGENGSGKSTLCKILLGIYDSESENDLCSKDISVRVPACSSVVFQNYGKYMMSIKENIVLSDTYKLIDDEQLNKICNTVDLSECIASKKEGLNTMLGREFDGEELSGGQWQRIAIARGLYRDFDFVVLDEPTAAIDPIEETFLYNKFMDICKNKTAVLITHRIGAAKIADRIAVMKEGEIVEIGNHNQLIDLNGEYKRMYELQKEWYL